MRRRGAAGCPWGSGDLLDPAIAQTPDELRAAFQAILTPPVADPCCSFWDCSAIVEEFTDTDDESDTRAASDTGTTAGDDSETGLASSTGASTTGSSTTGAATTGDEPEATGEPPSTSGGPGATSSGDPTTPTSGGGPGTTSTSDDTGSNDTPVVAPDIGCSCDGAGSRPPVLLLFALLLRRRRAR